MSEINFRTPKRDKLGQPIHGHTFDNALINYRIR